MSTIYRISFLYISETKDIFGDILVVIFGSIMTEGTQMCFPGARTVLNYVLDGSYMGMFILKKIHRALH